MSSLITLSEISKFHGAQSLFKDLSLSISEGDRIGVIGPNGAGKSTLMRILAGITEIDSGNIISRKDIRTYYCAQFAFFENQETIYKSVYDVAKNYHNNETEIDRVVRSSLARFNFDNFDLETGSLSGGQKKRLQLSQAICSNPDLLILDEPTNHLDLDSISLLEQILQSSNFAWVVVTHDRWFLQNSAQSVMEISPHYPNGIFVSKGNYDLFQERKDLFIDAEQKRISSLANVARREQAWLRQGVKARTTKAKYRIDAAHNILDSLAEAQARTQKRKVDISFSETDRKTKRLVELKNVCKSFDQRLVVDKLSATILSGQRLGLLGRNGSGKTTIINLITDNIKPDSGSVNHVTNLSIAYYQQIAEQIEPNTTLKDVLSLDSDSVVYRGESVHVAAWAQRFNFRHEQLNQPYSSLSGGEKARARIAKLMLTTADLLILDEPTNDLDVDTLEVLEQSLLDFSGAVILVTHDRYMITKLCTHYIGLNGEGGWQFYADFEQWQREQASATKEKKVQVINTKQKSNKKKLSYKEQIEFDQMEQKILAAESEVLKLQNELNAGPKNIQDLCIKLAQSQELVEKLYSRWAELEEKIK